MSSDFCIFIFLLLLFSFFLNFCYRMAQHLHSHTWLCGSSPCCWVFLQTGWSLPAYLTQQQDALLILWVSWNFNLWTDSFYSSPVTSEHCLYFNIFCRTIWPCHSSCDSILYWLQPFAYCCHSHPWDGFERWYLFRLQSEPSGYFTKIRWNLDELYKLHCKSCWTTCTCHRWLHNSWKGMYSNEKLPIL